MDTCGRKMPVTLRAKCGKIFLGGGGAWVGIVRLKGSVGDSQASYSATWRAPDVRDCRWRRVGPCT